MTDSARPSEISSPSAQESEHRGKAGSPNSGETSSRWWEFYAVRYAMGTVVGAIVFCFLCRGTPLEFLLRGTPLEPLIHGAATGPSPAEPTSTGAITLDVTHLALLAVCGLVYCYIASAPILVFHAGRFLLGPWVKLRGGWVKWLCIIPVVVVSPAGLLVIYYILAMAGQLKNWQYCMTGYFAVAALLVIVLQYMVSSRALIGSRDLFVFYRLLAEKREIALSPEKARGGIVDSYRHLREHGNSFFIVLLEVLLAALLVGTRAIVPSGSDPSSVAYLAVIVAWIFPAACVWGIGTCFEREFADEYNGKGQSCHESK